MAFAGADVGLGFDSKQVNRPFSASRARPRSSLNDRRRTVPNPIGDTRTLVRPSTRYFIAGFLPEQGRFGRIIVKWLCHSRHLMRMLAGWSTEKPIR